MKVFIKEHFDYIIKFGIHENFDNAHCILRIMSNRADASANKKENTPEQRN